MDEVEDQLARLLPRLRRFAHGLARDPADADDLLQATAERILKSRGSWQAGTNFAAWAYRVMRNMWIDMARTRQRQDRGRAAEEEGLSVGIGGDAEARVELAYLMRALTQLPNEQREAVVLVMIEEFSYAEAAQILDIPIGTLTSRLVRGRQALLALLED